MRCAVMVRSSALSIIAAAAFGGVAFAWVLPPTTPIGGPTLSEISRHVAAAAYAPAAPVDPLPPQPQPLPPIYDPGIPRVDLDARSPARAYGAEQVSGDSGYAKDYGPRLYVDHYDRAFRLDYAGGCQQRTTRLSTSTSIYT